MTDVAIRQDAVQVGLGRVNSALSRGSQADWPRTPEVSVEGFAQSIEMFSKLARLLLTWEGRNPDLSSSLILNLAPRDPAAHGLSVECHFFDREVSFHRDLAPDGGAPAPYCYWCEFDAQTGDFGVLLADLSSLPRERQLTAMSLGWAPQLPAWRRCTLAGGPTKTHERRRRASA